jgi:hypothetical protein
MVPLLLSLITCQLKPIRKTSIRLLLLLLLLHAVLGSPEVLHRHCPLR